VLYMDGVKVDRDVIRVVMAIHVCFQVYILNVSSVPEVCCKCFYLDVAYIFMLQAYVSSVFRCFIHMFTSVLSGCCIRLQWFSNIFRSFRKCLRRLFKVFHLSLLYVATVTSGCFKNRLNVAHEMRVGSD
jgi:hypothetical protein